MTTSRIIYQPKGRAGEYAGLALNLYRGCSHGCTYCYAPQMLKCDRATFHAEQVPKANAIERVERDAARLRDDPRRVLLNFTHDPYDPADAERKLTRQAIAILHRHGLGVDILTKAGLAATRDFDLLGDKDRVAVTLTCLLAGESLQWEPRAARPDSRLQLLHDAKAKGLKTWVSCEPVVDPGQTLEMIRRAAPYTDEFRVGTLNYHPRAKDIDWPDFGERAKKLLETLGCKYRFKNDLLKKMRRAHGTE